MAVAKRQEREKPTKIEQKQIQTKRNEYLRWNKHTPFLAIPICISQAQGGEETNV